MSWYIDTVFNIVKQYKPTAATEKLKEKIGNIFSHTKKRYGDELTPDAIMCALVHFHKRCIKLNPEESFQIEDLQIPCLLVSMKMYSSHDGIEPIFYFVDEQQAKTLRRLYEIGKKLARGEGSSFNENPIDINEPLTSCNINAVIMKYHSRIKFSTNKILWDINIYPDTEVKHLVKLDYDVSLRQADVINLLPYMQTFLVACLRDYVAYAKVEAKTIDAIKTFYNIFNIAALFVEAIDDRSHKKIIGVFNYLINDISIEKANFFAIFSFNYNKLINFCINNSNDEVNHFFKIVFVELGNDFLRAFVEQLYAKYFRMLEHKSQMVSHQIANHSTFFHADEACYAKKHQVFQMYFSRTLESKIMLLADRIFKINDHETAIAPDISTLENTGISKSSSSLCLS